MTAFSLTHMLALSLLSVRPLPYTSLQTPPCLTYRRPFGASPLQRERLGSVYACANAIDAREAQAPSVDSTLGDDADETESLLERARQFVAENRPTGPTLGALVVMTLFLFEHQLAPMGRRLFDGKMLKFFAASTPTLSKMLSARKRGLLLLALSFFVPRLVCYGLKVIYSASSRARRLIKAKEVSFEESLPGAARQPFTMMALSLVLSTAAKLLLPAALPAKRLNTALFQVNAAARLATILTGSWAALAVIERIEDELGGKRSRSSPLFAGSSSREDSVAHARVIALAKVGNIGVLLLAALFSLSVFGVNIWPLLTGAGAGGLVLGLAGKDMLSNYIGGMMVYLLQPFSIGDWIHSADGSLDGIVEHIGLYYTKVNTWDKRPMYVPNSQFHSMKVINASRMSNRRIVQTLRLRLQDASKIPAIVRDIRQLIVSHAKVDRRLHRLVYFNQVGSYSLDIWLSCYTSQADFLSAQQEILFGINAIVEGHGAAFASSIAREQMGTYPPALAPQAATAPLLEADATAAAAPQSSAAPQSEPLSPPSGFTPADTLSSSSPPPPPPAAAAAA